MSFESLFVNQNSITNMAMATNITPPLLTNHPNIGTLYSQHAFYFIYHFFVIFACKRAFF